MDKRYRENCCLGEALTTARARTERPSAPRRDGLSRHRHRGSESYVSPQLNDACAPDGAGDLAGSAIRQIATGVRSARTRRTAVPHIRVRIAPTNMIEHVEGVGPDFQRDRLVNRKLLRETQVDVREVWPDQRIAVSISEGAERRIGEGSRIEPRRMGTIRHARVTNLVRVEIGAGGEGWG